jgi:hypothetical protein
MKLACAVSIGSFDYTGNGPFEQVLSNKLNLVDVGSTFIQVASTQSRIKILVDELPEGTTQDDLDKAYADADGDVELAAASLPSETKVEPKGKGAPK